MAPPPALDAHILTAARARGAVAGDGMPLSACSAPRLVARLSLPIGVMATTLLAVMLVDRAAAYPETLEHERAAARCSRHPPVRPASDARGRAAAPAGSCRGARLTYRQRRPWRLLLCPACATKVRQARPRRGRAATGVAGCSCRPAAFPAPAASGVPPAAPLPAPPQAPGPTTVAPATTPAPASQRNRHRLAPEGWVKGRSKGRIDGRSRCTGQARAPSRRRLPPPQPCTARRSARRGGTDSECGWKKFANSSNRGAMRKPRDAGRIPQGVSAVCCRRF